MVEKKDRGFPIALIVILGVFAAGFLVNLGVPLILVVAGLIAVAIFKNRRASKKKRGYTERERPESAGERVQEKRESYTKSESSSRGSAFKGREKEENYDKLLQYALKLKKKIEKKMKNSKYLREKFSSAELDGLLEDYLVKIREMIERNEELKGLMTNISAADIRREIDRMIGRYDRATDDKLKAEYKKTIEQYYRHLESYDELVTQRELVGLRIRQSVNSLEQLQLDSTRVKELVEGEDDYIVREFEQRSAELSSYVDNLNNSYRELDREL